MLRLSILSLATCLAFGTLQSAKAHDLKVMAARLTPLTGETDTIYVTYGHIVPVDQPIEADLLQEYQLHTPSGSIVYLKKEGNSLQANQVEIEEEGLYQATAIRKAVIYTAVLDDQGTRSFIEGPRSSVPAGTTIDRATKSHQFSKALLVAHPDRPASHEHPDGSDHGDTDDHDHQHDIDSVGQQPLAVKPLGHTLEINPTGGPDTWRAGQALPVRILFQGQPLRGVDVLATYVGFKPDNAWCYATSTDGEGMAQIHPDRPGTWVMRVRTERPAQAQDLHDFDFDVFTATLVIEIKR